MLLFASNEFFIFFGLFLSVGLKATATRQRQVMKSYPKEEVLWDVLIPSLSPFISRSPRAQNIPCTWFQRSPIDSTVNCGVSFIGSVSSGVSSGIQAQREDYNFTHFLHVFSVLFFDSYQLIMVSFPFHTFPSHSFFSLVDFSRLCFPCPLSFATSAFPAKAQGR